MVLCLLLSPGPALACSSATGLLTSIAVAPLNPSVDVGQTLQFAATGTCDDGSTQDVTALAVWASSDVTVAAIDASGLATTLKAGNATISSTLLSPGGILTASTTLTAKGLVSVTVVPVNPSVAVNSTIQFAASGTYSDGSTQDLTEIATWTSSESDVATINSAGEALALEVGSTTISATRGNVSGSTTLTVAPAASELVVTPTYAHVLRNGALSFHASVGGKDVTDKVVWSSSSPTVATTDSQGQAQGLSLGTATIVARLGKTQGSSVLDVTTALPPVFAGQPADTNVSAVINPTSGVKVRLTDNLLNPLPGQDISMAIGINPSGKGMLSGAVTRTTDESGTAVFTGLSIDWVGTGYTLAASANPSSGPVSGSSEKFNEVRVGDVCLGPAQPSCAGTCADSDGDGLNDAWELAGGVDLNGDGKITDAAHDTLLTGADPNKQDIYVQYDWMDYGPDQHACSADADCTGLGFGHRGETCTGLQVSPAGTGSCRYPCSVDSDCTARGLSFASDRCVHNSCLHTHDPEVTTPGALDLVVESFAAHQIDLHLLRGHPLPHSLVTSLRRNDELTATCEGGQVGTTPTTAGPGKYAESFYDLKASSSLDPENIAYHYAIFGHYSVCDSPQHCGMCPTARNPDGSPKASPNYQQTGISEISGNDLLLSFGNIERDVTIDGATGLSDPAAADQAEKMQTAGVFMHELGHNLGMHHGGGIDTPCQTDNDCHSGIACQETAVGKYCLQSSEDNFKPNYISVMNYAFVEEGVQVADAVGSATPRACVADTDCASGTHCNGRACARLDYSTQALPTGGNTPGFLEVTTQNGLPGLNESAGLGSGTADLTFFTPSTCSILNPPGPTDGPLDFDGDGIAGDNDHASADLASAGGLDHICSPSASDPAFLDPVVGWLKGYKDWDLSGSNTFTYKFQCTPYAGPKGDGPSFAGFAVK